MLLTDLHIHSTFSDGKLTIPEIVDFYGTRGFDAIAITDHICETKSILGKAAQEIRYSLNEATFLIYSEILKTEAERAWKVYEMLLIPGIEVTKNSLLNRRSAHILGLGITDFITADLDVPTILEKIRTLGGLSCAAHPVSTKKYEPQTFYLWNHRKELKDLMDAWEVASGPHWFQLVEDSGLKMLANSDFHSPKNMTSWKTLIRSQKNQESIFRAIRNQNIEFLLYEEQKNDHSSNCSTDDLAHRHIVDALGDFPISQTL